MGKRLSVLDISLTAIFAALMIVGAYIGTIPIPLVPITLQTFFTYLSGSILGGRLGALSQLIYVLLGVFAPVYAGGGVGISHLVGPTGGYLVGFIPAAYVSGTIVEHRRNPGYVWLLFAMAVGTVPIYFLGALVLFYHPSIELELWGVLYNGILIFLPGDALKIILASYIALKTRPIVKALIPPEA